MKKTLLFAVSAIAVLALASCKKDEGPKPGDPTDFTFSATLKKYELTEESKATIAGDYSLSWAAGDKIAIFDGTALNEFTAAAASGATAEFSGKAGYGSAVFYGIYPFASAKGAEGNVVKLNVPASQNASATPIIAVGKADAQNAIALKNVLSYIEVNVPADVTSIVVSGIAGEKIAGDFSVNAETAAVKADPTEASVTFTPNGAGKYLIGIVPTDFAQGLKIDFNSALGNKTYKTAAVSFERGAVSKADSLAVTKAMTYTINNANDLKNWVTAKESWTAEDVVELGGDIDMQGIEWTPIDFAGTFDGKNHCIYNFVLSIVSEDAGFFKTLTGPVSNVIFGSKDGKNYDGTSKITVSGEGGWKYVGIIARAGADLKNITTYVPVEFAKDNALKVRGASLVGVANKPDMVIENCVSYADVTDDTPDKTANNEVLLGGLVSCCNAGAGEVVYVKNCKYYGSLSSNDPFTTTLGGIVSNCPKDNCVVIEKCENFGSIVNCTTKTPTDYKEGYVGGIVGYINSNDQPKTVIKECVNHADITCTGITVGNMGGIGGRITNGQYYDCVNEGKITFNGNVTGKALLIGGIAGGMYKSGTIDGCTNKGAVSSNKNQVSRLGGIIGTVNSGTNVIKNCKNEGALTISREAANKNWQSAGGIVGFQEASDACTIESCTNSGKVTIAMENNGTHGSLGVNAGGIVGASLKNLTTKNNVNTGDVALNVTGNPQWAYAGGIIAYLSVNTVKSEGDKSVCAVTFNPGSSNISACGAAAGNNLGSVTAPQLGGSVNGTALTADNVATLAVGAGNAATNPTLAK